MYRIDKIDGKSIFNVIFYHIMENNGIDYIEYRIKDDIVIHKVKYEDILQIKRIEKYFGGKTGVFEK